MLSGHKVGDIAGERKNGIRAGIAGTAQVREEEI